MYVPPKPCPNLARHSASRPFSIPRKSLLLCCFFCCCCCCPLTTAKQHLIACRNRGHPFWKLIAIISFFVSCSCCLAAPSCKHQASRTDPFATAKQHLMACRNVMQTYPQKLPNVSSKFLRKCFFFCLLQLLFGSSTLQASGRQNGPFATAKQDLIACRNCVQTYPQKLPNVLSEFLEKMSCFCLLQLLFGGSKLQASGLQNGHFTTAKQHRIFKLIDKISLTSLLNS